MLLKLQYKEHICHVACAAFIRGSSPEHWLKEINRWEVPVQQLECYVVPESIQSLQPAGLFVINKGNKDLEHSAYSDLYGSIADKLYLPIHAQLTPQVSTSELQNLLLWDRQLFHPTIGLVGFSTGDKLNLATLLSYPRAISANWTFAQAGTLLRPALNQITIQPPTLEEMMGAFKDLIDPQALKDFLQQHEDKSDQIKDLFANLNGGLLNGALSAIQKLKEDLSANREDDNGGRSEASAAQKSQANELFDQLERWLKQKTGEVPASQVDKANIQAKRDSELERLLDLFDKDTDEALKYAIPLDSPYLSRGESSPTSRLSPHSADFDLSKLGGGAAGDVWNVSSYYYDLRLKYQQAAQKEIEAKNYKKAAYIYAHLLGDFYAAARVLEQGKLYREAATLYKDHLNNMSAAAECLERGGLILEAIPLYKLLNKQEKVGDLYHTIGQDEQANQYYERSVDAKRRNGDFLDASRVLQQKLASRDRAKQTLLEGWSDSNQSESCLKQYFDLLATEEENKVGKQVQEIFTHQTPRSKRAQFLNVLVHLNEKHSDLDLTSTITPVAYQIISEQLSEGNVSGLSTLAQFVPNDHLIASDVSRFTSSTRAIPNQSLSSAVLQLDKSIKWVSALSHRNQFLALGVKDGRLHLARGNWYGNFEYYAWNDRINPTDSFRLVADAYYSHRVVILSSGDVVFEEKNLSENKYFDEELVVDSSYGSAKGLIGMAVNYEGGLTMLKAHNHALTLYHYYADGSLKSSADCAITDEPQLKSMSSLSRLPMIYRNGHYYAFKGSILMKIADEGYSEGINVEAAINSLAVSPHHTKLKVAIGTEEGCLLLKNVQGNLKAASNFFAQDITPNDLQFISANHLVVTGKYAAQVYQVGEDSMQLQQRIEMHSPIVAILTTASRHQCALLQENGQIAVYTLEND